MLPGGTTTSMGATSPTRAGAPTCFTEKRRNNMKSIKCETMGRELQKRERERGGRGGDTIVIYVHANAETSHIIHNFHFAIDSNKSIKVQNHEAMPAILLIKACKSNVLSVL